MKKVKLFTIDAPGKETLENGAFTNYEINDFLNNNEIEPKDISAEYNELTGKLLISIGYNENIPLIKKFINTLAGHTKYEVRFQELCDYDEKAHTVYIQKQLEDAINLNTHPTISHGIFVQNGVAKVIILEFEK